MTIMRYEVEKIARLANLDLCNDETDRMTSQLGTILQYVAKLDELDTSGVAVTTHSQDMVNSFREDKENYSLPREQALAASSKQNAEAFVVPKVVG